MKVKIKLVRISEFAAIILNAGNLSYKAMKKAAALVKEQDATTPALARQNRVISPLIELPGPQNATNGEVADWLERSAKGQVADKFPEAKLTVKWKKRKKQMACCEASPLSATSP
jgi:hypothetical protein